MMYPISEEVCSNCPACNLVTKDISGRPISEAEMYYQCISMAEAICSNQLEEE